MPEAVFIGGAPRSGTTLLASLLGSLPGCVVTPESQFKQYPLQRVLRQTDPPLTGTELQRHLSCHMRFRHWGVALQPGDFSEEVGPSELRELLLVLVRRFAERQAQKPFGLTWIDHTPQNIEWGLVLAQLFPGCRLIHLVRDPRAVAASLLPLNWGPHSPGGVAALWGHRLAHGLSLEATLPERICRVHYEALCREPERVVRDLAVWLGIGLPDTDILQQPVSEFLPTYTLHQHGLIGSPPRADRIDAWRSKLEPWEHRLLETRLGELMTMAGYPLDAPPPCPGERSPGPWRRYLRPLLRSVRGRIRHRLHQRRYAGWLPRP